MIFSRGIPARKNTGLVMDVHPGGENDGGHNLQRQRALDPQCLLGHLGWEKQKEAPGEKLREAFGL